MPLVPILRVPVPENCPMPQTKEQFIRFVDDPEVPERKRYEAMRHFMLSTLDFDPVTKEMQHKTYLRRNRPIPTPPPSTARYEDRVHNAKSSLTYDDYTHPLQAIAALLKDQVVLGIEKDILITEREATTTSNSLENRHLKQDIQRLETIRRQNEADLISVKAELLRSKANVDYLVAAREADRRKFQREERQLLAAWDVGVRNLDEANEALAATNQVLQETRAALARIATSLEVTEQTLIERVNENSYLKTEINHYLSSNPETR